MKDFKFDEGKHVYTLDGKKMTGVTTILGVIAKPALIGWAANMAVDYIEKEGRKTEIEGVDYLAVEEPTLKEARTAHRRKKEDAGAKGTNVHGEIEEILEAVIGVAGGKIPEPTTHENKQVQNFLTWAKDNEIQFISTEKRVYSEEHWYAGTCDLVYKDKEGKLWLGDIKTSKGIYGREWFAQMAGYQLALEEMGVITEKVHGRKIIRLGKTGDFETADSFDYETDKKIFLACVELYRGLQTYK